MDPWEVPNRHLVKDSAYLDLTAQLLCDHPKVRKFTFKDESEIMLCPDCGLEKGQATLHKRPQWKSA